MVGESCGVCSHSNLVAYPFTRLFCSAQLVISGRSFTSGRFATFTYLRTPAQPVISADHLSASSTSSTSQGQPRSTTWQRNAAAICSSSTYSDLHTSLFADIRRMWATGEWSDLTIIADGKSFKVHKNVVCHGCPFLKAACTRDWQVSSLLNARFVALCH